MRIDQDTADYFAIGDREDLSYEEKLDAYDKLQDRYFQAPEYYAFCEQHLKEIDDVMLDYVESDEFDELIVTTVRKAFPPQEHDEFIGHYRGLLAAWANDQQAGTRR